MPTRTEPYDPADALDTPESQAAFLSLAFADGDLDEIKEAIGIIARAQGMAEVARASGVGRAGLYRAFSADGNPELATVLRVLDALGIALRATPAHRGTGHEADRA